MSIKIKLLGKVKSRELRILFNDGDYQKYKEISIKDIDYTFIQN